MANHQGNGAQYPSLSTPSLLGGKAFGALKKQQEDDLDVVNQVRESKAVNKQMLHTHTHTQSFLTSGDYQDEDDEAETPLAERLEKYKSKQETLQEHFHTYNLHCRTIHGV